MILKDTLHCVEVRKIIEKCNKKVFILENLKNSDTGKLK